LPSVIRQLLALLLLAALAAGCAGNAPADAPGELTVYSGRSEELIGPVLQRFEEETGVALSVRYGDTAELAATILEEGERSPADVYIAQDAGALGALAKADILQELPSELLEPAEERFRDPAGRWVGVSGRARVIVWNTELLAEADVPDSVLELTDPRWEGQVGWAPTNGSFQAFVTGMRVTLGDEATLEWLEGMVANGARAYEKNSAIVEAVGRGEIELGLVNHYYLYQFLAEQPDFPAANHFLAGGDPGALVNVAGAGILQTTDQPNAAERLLGFLLSEDAQQHFADESYEYPLVGDVDPDRRLPALADIDAPEMDLSDLDDLEGTLELIRQSGALS
jgi:iron(III) transport system substrate-binding protein